MTTDLDRFGESFGRKMTDMIANGVDFGQVFRETLFESMGETPAQVFLRWLSPAALEDPRALFSEVKRHFGSGAQSICRLVEENAEKALVGTKVVQEVLSLGGVTQETPANPLVAPAVAQQSWRSLEKFGPSEGPGNAINGRLLSAESTGNKISFTRGSAFLLDTDAWASARKKLLASEAGAAMVREIWAQYGETIGLKARLMMGDATDLSIDAFEDIIEDSGIARVQFRGDKLYGTSLTMRVDNCILCDGRKPGSPRPCAEFLGILQGFTRALYGTRTVDEAPHNGAGGSCTFQVGRQVGSGENR